MGKYIRTLTILTDGDIQYNEIPLFRGAVLKALGEKASLLYHNHTSEDTYRYAYPLVQYKCINGKAAIVCVEDGVDIIGQYLTEASGTLNIGNREVSCNTRRVQPARILVQTWKNPFHYHISRWLPFNSHNYQLYQNTESIVERFALLSLIS